MAKNQHTNILNQAVDQLNQLRQ